MTDEQFGLLDRIVIQPLKVQGADVFIFGSRVTGKHHSHSDVDLLFRVTKDLPLGFISNIKEAIEESRFPFTVDLVSEQELAQSYHDRVNAEKIRV